MNKKYFPYIVLAVFFVAGIIVFSIFNSNTNPVANENKGETSLPVDTVEDDNDKVDSEDSTADNLKNNTPGEYLSYSFDKLSTDKTNVIFFAASWCPTCQALDSQLNKQLSEIPNEVQILKADYDKENSLRQKYGVTYQHTLVQVDSNGNKIKSWSGGYDLDSILSQII